jgi:Acyl-CoA reductase (LuxC)
LFPDGGVMTTGEAIAAAARLWLKRGSPWMARAKREVTAFSPQMVELGLRELFEEIATNVVELERRESDRLLASTITTAHVLSGDSPNAGVVSIIVGLLAGGRHVVKPASGDPMPSLFVESLIEVDRTLRKSIELTSDRDAYRHADVVVAYGDDETIATLKKNRRKAAHGRFFGFGSRVSIALLDSSRFTLHAQRSTLPAAAARDASLWDQQGCMSPQCFFVKGDAAAFAEALACEMGLFDRRWPRVKLHFADSAAMARARNEWGFRGRVWASQGSTHWTVVLDEHTAWAPSPLNRFIFVRPIELLLGEKFQISNFKSKISTVGFAGFSLKEVMAIAKADRYCSLGQMQRPSLLLANGSRPRVWDLLHEG